MYPNVRRSLNISLARVYYRSASPIIPAIIPYQGCIPMTELFRTVPRLLAVLSLAAVSACGGGSDSALTDEEGLVGLIPADSPYAFVMAERMPDAVLDKLEASSDSMYAAYATLLEDAMADGSLGREGEEAEAIGTLAAEILSMLQSENLRAAGVARGARIALYGVGLLPVMRMELSNPVAFEAKLAEFEATADAQMTDAEINGVPVQYLSGDGIRMFVAVIDDYAVVAVAHDSISEAQTAALLGITRPSESLADSGALVALAERYDFTGYGLGYLDHTRIANAMLDAPSGINAELLETLGYSFESVPQQCRTDIKDAVSKMPRLAFGYTDVTTDVIRSNTVAELSSELALGLSALSTPVPGMGTDLGGMGSFGFSLDLLAAREFLEARIDAYEADPYQCDWMAGLGDSLAQARAALAQPVPPVAYSIKGFVGVIDAIDGIDVTGQQPPTDVEARLLVASDNAMGLFQMGALFSPELQTLDIEPNGEPVELALPPMLGPVEDAWLAMTESALALGVGQPDPAALSTLIDATPVEPAPTMSIRLDGDRYRQFIADAMEAGEAAAGGGQTTSEEAREAMTTVIAGVGELIDRIAVDMVLTERGIELPSSVTLK